MALQTFNADDVLARFAHLLDGTLLKNSDMTRVLRVDGAPRSGKSHVALEAFVSPANRDWVRQGRASLIVSHRRIADEMVPRVIARIGNSRDPRPVKTIAALAFKLVQSDRENQGLTQPKLLNGAEQDVLIRKALGVHIDHAESGNDDSCGTCTLLKSYFSITSETETTVAVFRDSLTPAFVTQLRDMFARLSELHFGRDVQNEATQYREGLDSGARENVEWDLSFALWSEYIALIPLVYSDEFRIDPSMVLVEAEKSVARLAQTPDVLPKVVVVDDCQDLTVAGYSLLEELADQGCSVLLVGNDDESVQSFRGAYPEVLTVLETSPQGMNADRVVLQPSEARLVGSRSILATRVSQNIGSVVPNVTPVPDRPGKLAFPNVDSPRISDDETLHTRLFHTPAEEVDDLVWQIKSLQLGGSSWDDMAVVAHDNTFLRSLGRRFEQEGIPVSYSSVSRPLKEEPVVRGLLALLDLVDMRQRGRLGQVRERLLAVVASPLITVDVAGETIGRTLRFSRLDAAVGTLAVLEAMESAERTRQTEQDISSHSFDEVRRQWRQLGGTEGPIGRDGLWSVLILGDSAAQTAILTMLGGILSSRRSTHDPDSDALTRLVGIIVTSSTKIAAEKQMTVHTALWHVWDACGVASHWQKEALEETPQARDINRILDSVIRLFAHAESDDAQESLPDFIERVESLEIEADSLAKVAPKNNTVSLTTPAGAIGLEKRFVWIPGLQQQTWPNLTPRNTLFGAEILADHVLGNLLTVASGMPPEVLEGSRRKATVYSELKAFLVAVTRASESVTLSAVWADDMEPSEFLFAFLPEIISLGGRETAPFTAVGELSEASTTPSSRTRGGHDVSTRGLVTAARAALARRLASDGDTPDPLDDPTIRDAAQTLSYLAQSGVSEASPEQWAFVDAAPIAATAPDSTTPPRVTLSPSSVDGIWECPLKWSLENRFTGPRGGTVVTNFGSLIHHCAEVAAKEGWDRNDSYELLLERMMDEYWKKRSEQDPSISAKDQYEQKRQDAAAPDVLANIASYFVASRDPEYSTLKPKTSKTTAMRAGVGELIDVEAEKTFSATFSLETIVNEVAATQGLPSMEAAELFAALSALADGFASDFTADTVITLSGRLDRLEHRRRDGNEILNVIDYKSGAAKHRAKDIFSDLQLICYQLGLVKGAGEGQRPLVERSLLFDVRHTPDPGAHYSAPEATYQPALLARKGFNGNFEPRQRLKSLSALFDGPGEQAATSQAVAHLLEYGTELGNEQLVWCLTMVARIFYAASYRATATYIPKKGPQCSYCPFKGICPAWPAESVTVFGPSVGKVER